MLELLDRLGNGGDGVADVKLSHLGAVSVAHVLQPEGQLELAVRRLHLRVGVFKPGVGQAVAEGEPDLFRMQVVVAVAHGPFFVVFDLEAVAVQVQVLAHFLREGFGKLAGGIDLAGQNVGNGLAGGLAGGPHLQNGAAQVGLVAAEGGAAAGQHQDGVGIVISDVAQHVLDEALQMIVMTVDVFGVLGGLHAGEDQDGVIGLDVRHIPAEGVPQHVVGVLAGQVGEIVHLHAGQVPAQAFQRRIDVGLVREDLCGALAVDVGHHRVFAGHADLLDLVGGQGQQGRIGFLPGGLVDGPFLGGGAEGSIFQQADGLLGDLQRILVLGVAAVTLVLGDRTQQPFQHAGYGAVHLFHGQLAGLQSLLHSSDGVFGHAGHAEVQTGLQGAKLVMYGAPVGDHDALIAPFVPGDFIQQALVLAAPDGIDFVIGAHDAGGPGVFHRQLKGAQVDFPEGPLVDLHAGLGPAGLLGVAGKVLHGGADSAVLTAVDIGGGHDAGQVGILGKIFEVAAVQGIPLDVGAGAENHLNIVMDAVVGDSFAHQAAHLRIPGGAGGAAGGKTGAVGAGVVVALAVGAVRHVLRLNAQTLHACGGQTLAAAGQKRGFFF